MEARLAAEDENEFLMEMQARLAANTTFLVEREAKMTADKAFQVHELCAET